MTPEQLEDYCARIRDAITEAETWISLHCDDERSDDQPQVRSLEDARSLLYLVQRDCRSALVESGHDAGDGDAPAP